MGEEARKRGRVHMSKGMMMKERKEVEVVKFRIQREGGTKDGDGDKETIEEGGIFEQSNNMGRKKGM